MSDARQQGIFQGMGEGAVPDVVQEYGHLGRLKFPLGNFNPLAPELAQGLPHEVQGAQGMLKPVVVGSGVNQIGHPQLLDVA